MSFISEMDKTAYTIALDNILQAKILLERRGVYPNEKMEFYLSRGYLRSSEYQKELFFEVLLNGTGWTYEKPYETEQDKFLGIVHVKELETIFKVYDSLNEEQKKELNKILKDHSEFYEDEYCFYEMKMLFGFDGNIGIYCDYLADGLSRFLKFMLDFQEILQEFLEEIQKNNKNMDGAA